MFDGANLVLSNKKIKSEVVFSDEQVKYLINKHDVTIEASSAPWNLFEEYFRDGMNNKIFSQVTLPPPDLAKELEALHLDDTKVIAYGDL